MKKIIDNNDLGIPYTNYFNRAIVNTAKSLLGINRINSLYDSIGDYTGVEFAQKALEELNITVNYDPEKLASIPKDGPLIIISNHPHGALDGLLLASMIFSIRPDAKFMGNFLLERIEPMKEMFLSVNPFNSSASKNVSGIRNAMKHLAENKCLIIFPAGEVSTYYRGSSVCKDKKWENSIVKFIQSAKVPVLPLFLSGKNSMKFHLLGKIHPMLRTMRLPLELLNKHNYTVNVNLGSPISVQLQKELLAPNDYYYSFLRANIYLLKDIRSTQETVVPHQNPHLADVASATNRETLIREMNSIALEYKLFDSSNYQVFCAPSQAIPNLLREICRLRELTFRKVGEGTNLSIDTDSYDSYYHHVFIWDTDEQCIVGAYRLGFGKAILESYGVEGFYTYTLFEYSRKFSPILSQSIELGRSFIVDEYQKKLKPLSLLWQGILTVLCVNPECKYLIGPVSISNSYTEQSKQLIVNYIKSNHWNEAISKLVIPRTGLKGLAKVDNTLEMIHNIKSIHHIDKLISDIDPNSMASPILVKKYLELGGEVISFNIDHDFNDSLDALLLLDISKVPVKTLALLNRENKLDIDYNRFKN